MNTLTNTSYNFPNQTSVYKGKVREVYRLEDDKVVMIATDRLSAFDVVMPKGIPYKGQILNQIATKMMKATEDLVPNWMEASPDPNVAIGQLCTPFKVEMVIRGYMAGHAAREYKAGKRELCGVKLPEGLKENDKFERPIITPSTKADMGDHDEDISREKILEKGIVSEEDYKVLEDYTYKLFERGTEIAAKQGLILVDTKYEFGMYNGELIVIDEIHTPDSSRYWKKEGYQEKFDNNQNQDMLDKENIREWLINKNFSGEGTPPKLNDEIRILLSEKYIELFKVLIGKDFQPHSGNVSSRIINNLKLNDII